MQSLDEIYQAHAKTVYKYLLTMTHDEDEAEELTQETFYQAVRCIHKYDGSCKITTWLCAIAKNKYLESIKKKKHDVSLDEMMERDLVSNSAEEASMAAMNKIDLLKALHDCPEPYREVMYLRVFGNLSFKEIGAIMDQTENWARVTYYRGREKVKKEVDSREA